MKSLGIPSRVGGRSSGPLVPWSSGPLIRWSSGPLVLVRWSPAVRWSASPLVLWSFVLLSFFLSFSQLFSFLFFAFKCCFSFFSLCRDETKQGSKQASTSCSPLDLVWCWGGAAPPPNPPPRATKSALHPRHPRLPRNQYFEVNSPVQNFLTKQICFLYRLYLSIDLSIYRSIYRSIYLSIFVSVYLQFNIHKVLHLPRNLQVEKRRRS